MRAPSDLPDPLTKGPFVVSDALELGVSRARLRFRDLQAPYWGVRTPSWEAPEFSDAVAAAQLLMVAEAFSHFTAARILHLPLPSAWSPTEGVHIIGATSDPRDRHRGIRPHRGLEVRQTVMREDLRCTDPLTTWADLAPHLALDDLIVLGDAVMNWRRGIPFTDLSSMVASRAHHRGVRRMREALPLIRSRSDSAMETRSRLLFVRGGLPEPELNAPVTDEAGEWLATGDFVWREKRVVAEFDGDDHRTNRRRWQIDIGRREAVQDHGWHYVQLTADAVVIPRLAQRTLERLAHLLGVQLPR